MLIQYSVIDLFLRKSNMRKLECVDRKKFCGELYRLIVESESNSFQFIGKNGTGNQTNYTF